MLHRTWQRLVPRPRSSSATVLPSNLTCGSRCGSRLKRLRKLSFITVRVGSALLW